MHLISSTSTDGITYGAVRIWLRLESLAILTLAIAFYRAIGAPWWLFFAFLLAPDLALLVFLINPAVGSRAYNTVHSYALPVALAIGAFLTHRSAFLPYALIWTTHVALDRALGYGLKYPEAFGRTHLGLLGKSAPVK